MSNRDKNKYGFVGKFINFLNLDDPFLDDLEDDFDYEPMQTRKLKENVRDKLLTDEKYTFEEYLTLLELVTNKYKNSFNSGNGKYEIIFRERTFDERFKFNTNIEKKESEEKSNEER